jgi:hypothetical protein
VGWKALVAKLVHGGWEGGQTPLQIRGREIKQQPDPYAYHSIWFYKEGNTMLVIPPVMPAISFHSLGPGYSKLLVTVRAHFFGPAFPDLACTTRGLGNSNR